MTASCGLYCQLIISAIWRYLTQFIKWTQYDRPVFYDTVYTASCNVYYDRMTAHENKKAHQMYKPHFNNL